MQMQIISGQSIHKQVVIGTVQHISERFPELFRSMAENPDNELAAYRAARDEVVRELHLLYRESVPKVGEILAQTFEIHAMMIEDEAYSGMVESMICDEHVSAAFAVAATGRHYAEMLARMEDGYFSARSEDIREITNRLVGTLQGKEEGPGLTEPVILVTEEMSPARMMRLNQDLVLGLVTRYGSESSHTAILARTMNLPAVTGIDGREGWSGHEAILDGEQGLLILDPDDEVREKYRALIDGQRKEEEELRHLVSLGSVTKSGRPVPLYANVGCLADAALAAENGALGIGLLRSEFLYLDRDSYPTEEEQLDAYRSMVLTMQGKPVTIRTFDIGADKQARYMKLPEESNPALGFRAIRISLAEEEPFRVQLRSILKASRYGTVSVLYPMISSEWEIRRITEIFREEKERLERNGEVPGEVLQGVMIETPAAAIISDRLAEYVDFFSIGTNDLTQYLLAVDRQNPSVTAFYDAHHEALMRLISWVIEKAHDRSVPVCVCGELAADPEVTQTLLNMGVDALSVAPNRILQLKKQVRECE